MVTAGHPALPTHSYMHQRALMEQHQAPVVWAEHMVCRFLLLPLLNSLPPPPPPPPSPLSFPSLPAPRPHFQVRALRMCHTARPLLEPNSPHTQACPQPGRGPGFTLPWGTRFTPPYFHTSTPLLIRRFWHLPGHAGLGRAQGTGFTHPQFHTSTPLLVRRLWHLPGHVRLERRLLLCAWGLGFTPQHFHTLICVITRPPPLAPAPPCRPGTPPAASCSGLPPQPG